MITYKERFGFQTWPSALIDLSNPAGVFQNVAQYIFMEDHDKKFISLIFEVDPTHDVRAAQSRINKIICVSAHTDTSSYRVQLK